MKSIASLLLLFVTLGAHAELTRVNVCIPHFREEFLTLSLLEARDKGFFKEVGLDVQFTHMPNEKSQRVQTKFGQLPKRAVTDQSVANEVAKANGRCQFGSSVIEQFMFSGPQDQVRPIMVSMYGDKYDTHLVVAKDSKIRSVADLKGKLVRLGQLPTHIALNGILKEAGLTIADVKPEFKTGAVAAISKLESGEIDALITYVPTMPYLLASGKVRILKSSIIKGYVAERVPHSLLIASKEAPADAVKRFTVAVEKANAHLMRNPSDVLMTFQRNAQVLGFKPIPANAVVLEKAGSFVGNVAAVNLTTADEAQKQEVVSAINRYNSLVNSLGYTDKKVDLHAWFSGQPAPSKVGAL